MYRSVFERASLLCALALAAPSAALAQAPAEPSAATTSAAESEPSAATTSAAESEPSALAQPVATAAESEPEAPRIEVRLGEGVRFRAGEMFSLQIRARMQLQGGFTVPTAAAIDAGAAREIETSFLARRVRLVLAGHVYSPKLQYYFQFGFSYRDMEPDRLVPVRDAYMTWRPMRDLSLRWGQMKVPYGLQRVVSSSAQQMVDRSVVTNEFNLDRDVGVYAFSEDLGGLGGKLNYYAGVFGGRGRNRFGGANEAMFVARFQVNPFGSFDHLSEGDFTRSSKPRLAIGFGAAYHLNGVRTRGTHSGTYEFGTFDSLHVGADVHLKWRGLSFSSEFFYRTTDEANRSRPDANAPGTTQFEYARRGTGFRVQAGYMLPQHLEFSARYGEIRPTSNAIPGGSLTSTGGPMEQMRELGAGFNYYIVEHALKVQVDYFRLWNPDDASYAHNQVRLQTQVYF